MKNEKFENVPKDDIFAVNDKVQRGVYHDEEVVENDGEAGGDVDYESGSLGLIPSM